MAASALPYLSDALVFLGLALMTVGVYGMIRFNDTYLKLQAASKVVLLGVLPLLAASAATGDLAIISRAALMAALLFLVTPVATHVITKATYQREKATEAPEDGKEPQKRPPAE